MLEQKIKKEINNNSDQQIEINLYIGDSIIDYEITLLEAYDMYKDQDGFLYLSYCQIPLKPDSYQSSSKIQESETENDKLSQSIEEEQNVQVKAKCVQGHQAFQLCSQQSCKQPIFICTTENCKCQSTHQKCQKLNLKSAVKNIKNKFIDFDKSGLEPQIDKLFDQMIDDISVLRDRLLTSLKEHLKYSQVQFQELHLLKVIETGEQEMFLQSYKVKELIAKKSPPDDFFKELTYKLDQIKEGHSFNLNIYNKFYQEIKSRLNYNKLEEMSKTMEFLIKKYGQANKHLNFQQSSIISDQKMKFGLWINFHQRPENPSSASILADVIPFESIKLLYKASEENFSIGRYFEKCGDAQNTLILCLTNNGKIIGAYSPLSHGWDEKQNKQSGWTEDKERKSFIFSLSSADKFELECCEKAVYRDEKRELIRFGEGQFEICDKSNVNEKCYSEFNNVYSEGWFNKMFFNSKQKQEKFYLGFNGNRSSAFTTKEWEVWQIQEIQK